MKKSLKEFKQEYQTFLNNIPTYLEKVKLILNKKDLTFDFAEIEEVKRIYEQNYKQPNILNLTDEELSNMLYAYFGEAFIHHLGGEWALGVTKSDEAYGSPTIIKWGGEDYPWSRISPKVWKIRLERGKLGPAKLLFGKW